MSAAYIELRKNQHTILIFYRTISDTDAKIDGNYVTMDVRAEIRDGITYIPYRFAAQYII
jgi:hypothetical protein